MLDLFQKRFVDKTLDVKSVYHKQLFSILYYCVYEKKIKYMFNRFLIEGYLYLLISFIII